MNYCLTSQIGAVATVTLNRPEQMNPLSSGMIAALRSALDDLAQNNSVHVVVIAATGRSFCAGHDLHEMRANPDYTWQKNLFDACSELMLAIQHQPQPVIAQVQGIATAAGCQLVSMCDLAVAAESARFCTPGVNLAMFCSTPAVGVSRNLGRKAAMKLLLTGEFISATEALQQGLLNEVVADAALATRTQALAQHIASKEPTAIRMGKHAFYQQIELGIADAYEQAAHVMACNMQLPSAKLGIDAFLNRKRQ
jgi:enoyl-CoA hydratase/carnithine racemase